MSAMTTNDSVSDAAALRIGATGGIGEVLLKPALPKCRRCHPEVPVEQRFGTSGEIVAQLLLGHVHIAICGWVPELDCPEGVGRVPLFRDAR